MRLFKLFDFSEELSGLHRFYFLLKDYLDGYFGLNLREHFLCELFPSVFFLGRRRTYTRKKPRRNSVNENSSEVRKNTNLEEH